MGEAEAAGFEPVEVTIHVEATVAVWSETALFFMAAASNMDPRISGVSLDERLEDMSDSRWTPLLELIAAERLVEALPGVEFKGSTCWVDAPAWDED
ncbi:hypothetical protein [Microbacterium sp. NPDC096154]|uniref:hypothetical protein n=1 Tax=Microbacterium sp. NPDC096154 TaxID=3155549 RepID=UPI00332AFA94